MRGRFVPATTMVLTADEIRGLDEDAIGRLLDAAMTQGIGDVIVEIDDVPPALVAAAAARGLRLLIGVTCFHEHGAIGFGEGLARRPVGADGKPRPRMEWYVGLLPTDTWVVAELISRCARLARTPGVHGLVLDFIRWPLHWELELREGGPRLPAASFDEVTIADFAEFSGIPLPRDPQRAASAAQGPYAAQWHSYRAAAITRIVGFIAGITRDAGIALGAFVVPIDPLAVGQDLASWAGIVDVIYPMTYHAILHRPPSWVAAAMASLDNPGEIPAVPIIQLAAGPAVSGGWDWGPEFGPDELLQAVAAGSSTGPVAFFPGSALVNAELRIMSSDGGLR